MESAWKSSIHLKDDWITRVLEDYDDEVDKASTWAVKLLKGEVRTAVWSVCAACGVPAAGGLPGHACLLLERYLAITLRQKANSITNNEDWDAFKRVLWSRMPLLIASCVQLATKMVSATVSVHPKVVRSSLLQRGIEYSIVDIVSSEYNVFSTIGFKVPLWTSEDVAQLMAVEVGLPVNHLERLAMIINVAEYRRNVISERVCNMFSGLSPSAFNTAKLHTLHLAAGAVLACARFHNFVGPDPSPRLSKLTRAPLQYIILICNLILSFILQPSDSESNSDSDSDVSSDSEADSRSDSDSDSLLEYVTNKRFKFSN